jgi:hypothetical protein
VTTSESYRLRKTVGNKTAFAAVNLLVSELRKSGSLKISIEPAHRNEEWFKAAAAGARPVADFILWHGGKLIGAEIKIDKVQGNPSDTTADFIECVSGMATWRALAPNEWPEPEVVREGRWVLKYRILPSLSA